MKKTFSTLLLMAVAVCLSTSISAQTDSDEVMSVKGITNSLLNRVISFGDYSSSKIKAVKVSTSFSFGGVENGITNMKYAFSETSPDGTLDVSATDNPDKELLNTVREFLGSDISGKSSYIGTMKSTTSDEKWHFYINPAKGSEDRVCGSIKSSAGDVYTVSGNNTTSGKEQMMNKMSFHYDILLNGEKVGSVSTDQKGQVWIKSDLPANVKLAIAATASALFTRIGMGASM